MTTQISNRGTYVMYEREVDSTLAKKNKEIQQFKAEKVNDLLKEETPYNLKSESGRVKAIHDIRSELSDKIEIFSHEAFQQPAHDIAFSIVSKAVGKLK